MPHTAEPADERTLPAAAAPNGFRLKPLDFSENREKRIFALGNGISAAKILPYRRIRHRVRLKFERASALILLTNPKKRYGDAVKSLHFLPILTAYASKLLSQ